MTHEQFTQIYLPFSGKMYALAYNLLRNRDEARDCVQAVAKLHKIVVIFKGGQINPHAVETAVVVLGIRAAIDCGVAVLIVRCVLTNFVLR